MGVVLKHRALMAQRRARDVEGTPSRSDLMRPRLEAARESMDCEEDDDDLERPSACDVDAAWHAAKGLALVPVRRLPQGAQRRGRQLDARSAPRSLHARHGAVR